MYKIEYIFLGAFPERYRQSITDFLLGSDLCIPEELAFTPYLFDFTE